MNEKFKIFIPYIVAFVAGAVIFGGLSGFWVRTSANNRIADLEEQNAALSRTNSEIRRTNTELTDTVRRDAELKQQLSNTIAKQQRELETARKDLEGAINANKLAGRYTSEAVEYIDFIIERYSETGSEEEIVVQH